MHCGSAVQLNGYGNFTTVSPLCSTRVAGKAGLAAQGGRCAAAPLPWRRAAGTCCTGLQGPAMLPLTFPESHPSTPLHKICADIAAIQRGGLLLAVARQPHKWDPARRQPRRHFPPPHAGALRLRLSAALQDAE